MNNKLIEKQKNDNGKEYVMLNFRKCVSVHRIIATLFIPNDDPVNKTEINHINYNKADNRVENLEWCTKNENMIHAKKNKEVGS